MKITVVIPTLNEEKSIGTVIKDVKQYVDEIILVDRSTDKTVEIARKIYPKMKVVKQKGRGKGNALRAGFEKITGDYVVSMDADESHIPEEIPKLIDAAKKADADMVIASRFMGKSEEWSPIRYIGNLLMTQTINLLWGGHITDTQNGFRLIKKDLVKKMDLESDGFEIETEMCIRALKLKAKVVEIPSHELERRHGDSRQMLLINIHRHILRVLKELVRG